MKKILILTKGLQASSTRDRALIYDNCLKEDNIFKHIGLSKRPLNYLKAIINVPFYDVVFLQRKLLYQDLLFFIKIFVKKNYL